MLHFQAGNLASLDWTYGSFQEKLLPPGEGCTTSPYRLCLDVAPHYFSRCAGPEILRIATFTAGKVEYLFLNGSTLKPSALVFVLLLGNFSALRKIKVHQNTEESSEVQSSLLPQGIIRQINFPSVYFSSRLHFSLSQCDNLRQQQSFIREKGREIQQPLQINLQMLKFNLTFPHSAIGTQVKLFAISAQWYLLERAGFNVRVKIKMEKWDGREGRLPASQKFLPIFYTNLLLSEFSWQSVKIRHCHMNIFDSR